MKVNKLAESFSVKITDSCQLNEDTLVEGPLTWLKDKVDPKGADARHRAMADKDAAKEQKKAEKTQTKMQQNPPAILAKDFDSKNSNSKFYKNHNYSKPYTQAGWREWIKRTEDDIAAEKDEAKKKKAQDKLTRERVNAIVVNDKGFYVRRGSQDMKNITTRFLPGENDEILRGYYMEPYRYVKDGSASKKQNGGLTADDAKKFKGLQALTGIQLFDKQTNKPVESIGAVTAKELSNYEVRLGTNVRVPLADWLKKARSSKLL